MFTDASDTGFSGILCQAGFIVELYSATFDKAQLNYTINKKELFALYKSLKKFAYYIYNDFTVFTDHEPLLAMVNSKQNFTNKIEARWISEIRQHDINLKFIEGYNNVSDYFSRYSFNINLLQNSTLVNNNNNNFNELVSTEQHIQFSKLFDKLQKADIDSPIYSKFMLRNNLLFIKDNQNDNYRLIIPDKLIPQLLEILHNNNNHINYNKLYTLAIPLFYFPNMKTMIKEFCSTCIECQRNNNDNVKNNILNSIPKGNRKFQLLHMDVLECPNEYQNNNFKYILTVLDSFSRFGFAYPLATKQPKEVIDCLLELFMIIGKPEELYCDLGSNFVSEYNKIINSKLDIKMSNSFANNHKTAGIIERFNQTIQNAIRKLNDNDRQKWPSLLKFIINNYNSVPHGSLKGLSPYQLVFGMEPNKFIINDNVTYDISKLDKKEYYNQLIDHLNDLQLFKTINENNCISQNARININLIDRKNKFNKGDLVMLKNLNKQSKWNDNWVGPYVIKDFVSQGVLVNLVEDKKVEKVIHLDFIKKYNKPTTFSYENDNVDDMYEIQKIINHKIENNQLFLQVKFKNYDNRFNRYIKLDDFSKSDMLNTYLEEHQLSTSS